jgi:elongation factor 3
VLQEPVRAAAEKASRTLIDMTSPHAMAIVLPVLYEAMTDIKKKWQTRRGGLVLLGALAHRSPTSIAESVPAIIPIISECMRDVRKEVVVTAEEVMFAVASVVGNKDIEPFIPALISAISRPSEVPECVHRLSATTFVQQVDAATLAVIVPVLTLGLREPAAAIKRMVRPCADLCVRCAPAAQHAPEAHPRLPVAPRAPAVRRHRRQHVQARRHP